jgi:hypothetical protein
MNEAFPISRLFVFQICKNVSISSEIEGGIESMTAIQSNILHIATMEISERNIINNCVNVGKT